jgi:hypothetical protein
VTALFGFTLASGAALMFLLEPMAAKMVLPHLGGAPAVWNTCVVFFQCVLLAGYAYAHALPRWLGVRRHALIHAVLVLASGLTLLAPFRIGEVPTGASPAAWLLLSLLKAMGLPFFVLATGTPLLQRWFSTTRHTAARDPYFLYAASNFGSLAGLLMYPFVVEPILPLRAQVRYWTYAYMGFALLIGACAVYLRRNMLAAETGDQQADSSADAPARPTRLRRLRWLVLSFAPSSLMLAVTTFISTDIAVVPLMWVLPLGLYLLTFVLAFSSSRRYPRKLVDRGLPLLIVPLVVCFVFGATGPPMVIVPIHLGVFFLAALSCHLELADDRPDPSHLTEFYLLLALGGVLGSLFNTLAAPVLFTAIVEYPAVLLLVCLLRRVPETYTGMPRAWLLVGPLIAAVGTSGFMLAGAQRNSIPALFLLFGTLAFVCLSLSRTRLPFAAALALMLASTVFRPDPFGRQLLATRTFFGTYRVHDDESGAYRTLTHGTTIHGMQRISAERLEPVAYYHTTGPLGDLFRLAPVASLHHQVAVVGLGIGTVASYRKPEQVWTFYEIDPAVEAIARDRRYFSYMADCGTACRVVIGDARQSLAAASASYGVIVLDAFSSDAIPLHLLTREALELYLSRLASGGFLAFHISNRHLDLEAVLARLAADAGLTAVIRRDHDTENAAPGKSGSVWVAVARNGADLGQLSPAWRPAHFTPSTDLWTDDFSNILKLVVWRH